MPQISVIMSVHNGLPYLSKSVESILDQSFRDFEFVIVDDASTDASANFLKSLNDARVRLVLNKKNLGLSRSLNKAWGLATGKYIARMDHDDISLPGRLKQQRDFMDSNPKIDLVGTWAKTLGRPKEQVWRYPSRDEDLRSELVFNSPFVHSSVMLRRKKFDKLGLRYDPKIPRAQDYDLWSRAAPHVRFANLQKVLLLYRIHSGQVGQQHGFQQSGVADNVRKRELQALGLQPTKRNLKIHSSISRWEPPRSVSVGTEIENWLLILAAANNSSHQIPEKPFKKALESRWWATCRAFVAHGFDAWRMYTGSTLGLSGERSLQERIQFWVKCLLRELGWKRA